MLVRPAEILSFSPEKLKIILSGTYLPGSWDIEPDKEDSLSNRAPPAKNLSESGTILSKQCNSPIFKNIEKFSNQRSPAWQSGMDQSWMTLPCFPGGGD
jgi:hypothetical protein